MTPGGKPEDRISTSTRRRLRNKERKLQGLPGYRYRIAATDAEINRVLDAFFVIKPQRMALSKLPDVFSDEATRSFIRDACLARLPDGSRDMVVEKTILLEAGFDELAGVDWQKGCFLGQELTARTKYRGLIKRRLLPVRFEGPAPAPGTQVLRDGRDAGEMRSSVPGIGLALLRLESLAAAESTGAPLMAGETRLRPERPSWVKI